MIKTDSIKYQLLEMVGLCGEFPSGQLNRLIESDSYAEKVVTDLKQSKLIRTHYKDGLRGYRLTKRAKELLLSQNPCRFQNYLTGNAETNLIRSELPRRLRLHQKAETYLTLSHAGIPFFPDEKPLLFSESSEAATFPVRSLPLFYSSREIKNLGASTTKIKNSRCIGILMAPHCVYAVYNTGNTLLKWEYKTEVRLNAFLQHYLQGLPYHGPPTVYAIMTGSDMDMAFRLLTSTGGYKKTLFMLDTSYEHFYFLPNNSYGEYLLRLLVQPQRMMQLNQLLLSDCFPQREDLPIEHDGIDSQENPILLAYDFDMQRINRFNTGLNVYGLSGNLIICDGNWHSCIYVRCVSCKTPGYCNGPHFLYHPDENGSPCVLPMADARMLFSRIPEPTECLSAITLEQFQSLYGLYFAKEALTDKPCPCFALLRHQEASHYHW